MTTNETLEATYKVYYYPEHPNKPPQDNKFPRMNYRQAIDVATGWMKDHSFIEIRDDSIPILNIRETRGVEFITDYKFDHPRLEEHYKIKIALNKVWDEIWSNRLQP